MKYLLISLSLLAIQFSAGSQIPAPSLSASYNKLNNSVKLKWQNNNSHITGFILQRSAGNNLWNDLYRIIQDAETDPRIEIYTDKNPDPNKNIYRLKTTYDDNKAQFSPPIIVIIGNDAGSWVMFPVPVGPVLNLQYTGSESITGAITVIIQNMNGMVLCRQRTSTLSRTIQVPVAHLGSGMYEVKIIIREKIVWNQRFVK
jgi:hypothetical protein